MLCPIEEKNLSNNDRMCIIQGGKKKDEQEKQKNIEEQKDMKESDVKILKLNNIIKQYNKIV